MNKVIVVMKSTPCDDCHFLITPGSKMYELKSNPRFIVCAACKEKRRRKELTPLEQRI
jgi:RNase P subunit RPR2